MPRTKKVLRRYGTVIEEELTYETNWVQVVGESVVRCDHTAKSGGCGSWTRIAPKNSAYWTGTACGINNLDPKNWIRDDHTETIYSESDYS